MIGGIVVVVGLLIAAVLAYFLVRKHGLMLAIRFVGIVGLVATGALALVTGMGWAQDYNARPWTTMVGAFLLLLLAAGVSVALVVLSVVLTQIERSSKE
jgi:hypothetical protein